MSKFPRGFTMDRRGMLGGVASLATPVVPGVRHLLDGLSGGSMSNGKLVALLSEYRQLDGKFAQSMADLERAEQDARARDVHWNDCPKVTAAFEEEGSCLRAMTEVLRRAARTPGSGLDEVVLKLVLWRLSDAEADSFDNPWDMLSFSAYRDLLTLTGHEALAHPADEEARAALWDDNLFKAE